MRSLVILRGSPASGKSTWVKNNNLQDYCLSADGIRLLVQSPIMSATENHREISQKNDSYVSEARYVYEKHYGEIPKGYWVYHLDGNVSNNNIDNLIALDRKIVASLNITGLKSTDKDLTKLGIDILKINRKIKERKKEVV